MLSKEEWNAVAERAAAADYGTRHAGWLRFKRFGLAPTALLVIVGGLGLGAWWLFSHVADLLSGTGYGGGHLPAVFWIAAAVTLTGTIAAFRLPAVSVGILVARLAAVLAWIGLAVYGVTVLA